MTVTDDKLNANRQNALYSTGPRTPEGKTRSARNAARHGLRGTSRVSPVDAAALADLREALTARLTPADAVEHHWVGEIAFALWQQRKLQGIPPGRAALRGWRDLGGSPLRLV